MYIWQDDDWPNWQYDLRRLAEPLTDVSAAQGRLMGRLTDVDAGMRNQASLQALTSDVLKTSEIEGELLNAQSVRSSLARRLGVDIGALAPVDRYAEGVVEMVLDATENCLLTLTEQRIKSWHAALFPTGYSGLTQINVGQYRDVSSGKMQVVSGPIGRQRVHFEAPMAQQLDFEMARFVQWVNTDNQHHPLIKAALAHLWFVTIHPFDDGNGRIGRAIGDLLLARAENSPQRFYSLSAQIQRERGAYYDILEQTQKSTLDVTQWLEWFLNTLNRAILAAHDTVEAVLQKAFFWQKWATLPLNARQIKLLNLLVDGFEGKRTSKKWALIAKCSPDTALRDINELMGWKVLQRSASGGRSTTYEICNNS